MEVRIPDFALVLLIGAPGAGKSWFARRAFGADEIVDGGSGDPEGEIARRLAARQLTVVDHAGASASERSSLIKLAKEHHARTAAILLDLPLEDCLHNNASRSDGVVKESVVRQQHAHLRRTRSGLAGEGFAAFHHVKSAEDLAAVTIEREPLACDLRQVSGRFDIIGDVHGCRDELIGLMTELGYDVRSKAKGRNRTITVRPPAGRRAIFVGDLVDRGPASPDVLRIVMGLVARGDALCVLGNHDSKFIRWLHGRDVKLTHGLQSTVEQFRSEPQDFRDEVLSFLETLPVQLWLDNGALVVAHAGVREDMIGREGGAVREFCLFGDRSGGRDELGLPIRYHWGLDYRGPAAIVYGHTPVAEAAWVNNTLCIDTGCAFGGRLTALRWPEREIVSLAARRAYAHRRRSFGHPPPRPREAVAREDQEETG